MIDNHNIVVTMTSWKQRISTAASLIYEFCQIQTCKPDKFYLWLSLEEFPNKESDLPVELVGIKDSGMIDIKWLPGNEKTFKRWHVYPEHWNDYVVVIDDDCHYSPTLIADAIEVLKKNSKTVCNLWPQFSAVPRYSNDIKIKFEYDFENHKAIWICGNCAIPPQTFPLDALSDKQTDFKDKHFSTNDEVILISYFLRDGISASFVPHMFPFKTISNESATSLKADTGEKFDMFGYSAQEVQLYQQLKFLSVVDKYAEIHPGYDPSNYQKIINEDNKHVWIKLVVTAHNNEKQIGRCIDSILSQTYKDFALVVVDDYSTDNTLSEIKTHVRNDQRTMVISNRSNIRQGRSRNIGLKAGPISEFTWFVDGDDYLSNSDVLMVLNSQINENLGFDAYTLKYYIDDNSMLSIPNQIQYNFAYQHNLLFTAGTVAAWSRIHATKSIDCEFRDIFHEDCIWFAEWLNTRRKIKDLDIAAYVYYKNQNGECQRLLRNDPSVKARYSGFLRKMIEIFNSSTNIELKRNLYLRLKHENLIQENNK